MRTIYRVPLTLAVSIVGLAACGSDPPMDDCPSGESHYTTCAFGSGEAPCDACCTPPTASHPTGYCTSGPYVPGGSCFVEGVGNHVAQC